MPDRKNVIKGLQNLREAIATDFIHEADQAVGTIDDALALLKEQNGLMLALEQSNAVNGYLNAEVERLNGLLKEQDNCENCAIAIEDRQPVVRCKDCRYGQYCTDGETTYQCFKWNSNEFGALHEQDWFCADGERKEGR